MSHASPQPAVRYQSPGASRWLLDVFSYRQLLGLLLKKGTSTRYYGTFLGWAWSYVRPALQFAMYYFVIGEVFGMRRGMELFALYIFSGIVILNFFRDALGSSTNSITGSGTLIKKIYLPRELFPVASVASTFIHFLPQVILLVVISAIFGWRPSWINLLYIFTAIAIVFVFVLGLGLFFSAVNVVFRDAKNIVSVMAMFSMWTSPVIYSHEMIRDVLPAWIYNLYMVNPVTVSVELFHSAFYREVMPGQVSAPDYMLTNTLAGIGMAIGTLLLGQVVFRRLEGDFAQDL